MTEQIIDNVRIIDCGNGKTRFVPIENESYVVLSAEHKEKEKQPSGFLDKVVSWWDSLWGDGPKPYVRTKDLADPFGDRTDADVGGDGKTAVEIGVKISF